MPQQKSTEALTSSFFIPKRKISNELIAELKSLLPTLDRAKISSCRHLGGAYQGHLNLGLGNDWKKIFKEISEIVFDETGWDINAEYTLVSAGANINLPKSFNQRFHIDGSYNLENLVIHYYLDDVDESNGAHELVPFSHETVPTFANLVFKTIFGNLRAKKLPGKAGTVIVRYSRTWHRGTQNHSSNTRIAGTFVLVKKHESEILEHSPSQKFGLVQPNGFKTGLPHRCYEIFCCRLSVALNAMRFCKSLSQRSFWSQL
ncbi:phytanoyl-CoA dioxygenase family protein [Alphaproteobacteria bacterium]|nr:phytanoyl-CoA dioxygenase family protein [Alphaproteobacteria bacterium]